MKNQETVTHSAERHDTHIDTPRSAEHHEAPRDHHEKLELAHDRERDAAEAQIEALKSASSSEQAKSPGHEATPTALRHGPISRHQLDARFAQTMEAVREELSPTGRVFSKFIHAKPIEKTSDAVGATIARPNALLVGTVFAFAITLALYLFAKDMGYRLSGFEPLLAFVVGWMVGTLYDYFRVMITGKK